MFDKQYKNYMCMALICIAVVGALSSVVWTLFGPKVVCDDKIPCPDNFICEANKCILNETRTSSGNSVGK
jgi:hypothetical protein